VDGLGRLIGRPIKSVALAEFCASRSSSFAKSPHMLNNEESRLKIRKEPSCLLLEN